MSDYISLKQLANELGLDKSSLRKYIIKEGFPLTKCRMPDSSNQTAIAFTKEIAGAIKKRREGNGFMVSTGKTNSDAGYFYIIQVIPEVKPNRIKFGYAISVGTRLQAHRTIAPTARLLKSWACRAIWENAAMDSITREGCQKVGGEVFDCDSLEKTIERGEQFFKIMPQLVMESYR